MRKNLLLILVLFFLNSCKQDEPVMASFEFTLADEGKVTFKNTSMNAENYEWDFGNGNKSNETNPSIQYPKNGDYSVVLIAKGKKTQDTKIQKVIISSAPKPIVKFSYKTLGNGLIEYTNETQNADSYKWTLGNGEQSIEKSPKVQYKKNGTYEVKLEATNINYTIESLQNVIVADAPKPISKFSYKSLGNGLIEFTNETQNADTYKWSFGNVGQSTEKSPKAQFLVNGTYEVKLEATNFNGTVESKQNITIADAPKPIADFSINYGTNGYVSFSNLSKNASSYQWTFGNGQSSPSTDAAVNYSSNGNYSVTLTAKNQNGENTVTKTASVNSIFVPTTGSVIIWTNFNSNNIKIYVNGTYRGLMTKYTSSAPSCGAEGFVTITLPQGAYSFTAEEDKFLFPLKWSGTLNFTNGQCKSQQLTK